MSALTSIAVTRGLPHAARSSRLGVDRDRRLAKQRVAVADPPATLAADDASLVHAIDLVQPPLAAAVAHDDPPVDALVQPAAPEEHRPRAPPLSAPVAAALAAALAVQAALVAADEARAGTTRRADHPQAEHRPGPGAARRAEATAPRVRGLVGNILALADLAVVPRARRSGARRGLTFIATRHGRARKCEHEPEGEKERSENVRGAACDRHGNDSAGRCRAAIACAYRSNAADERHVERWSVRP